MIKTLILLALTVVSSTSMAAKKIEKRAPVAAQAAAQSTSPKAKPSKLSRDISFRGSSVDGKYLSAGESVAEVEKEKEMGALIGIRKNFHDRLGAEAARLNAQSTK